MIFRGKGGDFFFFFFFAWTVLVVMWTPSSSQPQNWAFLMWWPEGIVCSGQLCAGHEPDFWSATHLKRGFILSIFLHLCSPLLLNVHNKTGWSCYRKTPNNLLYWLPQWRGWLGHGDSKLILFLAASARAQEMWEQAVNHTCCCTSEYLTFGWWGGDWRTGLGKASTALWSGVRAGKILMEQGCWKFFMEMRKGW